MKCRKVCVAFTSKSSSQMSANAITLTVALLNFPWSVLQVVSIRNPIGEQFCIRIFNTCGDNIMFVYVVFGKWESDAQVK